MQGKSSKPQNTARPLATTLTRAFVTLSLLSLLLVGGGLTVRNYQARQQALASQQRVIALDAAHEVSGFIEATFSVLRTSSRSFANPDVDPRPALENVLGVESAFREVALLDAAGQELVKLSRLSVITPDDLENHANSELITQVGLFQRHIGSVHIDEITSELLVTMAVPVKGVLGEFRGALVAEVNLKFMWDLVGSLRVGREGLAYVVDERGDLIAARDISRVLRGENLSHLDQVAEFVNSPGQGAEGSTGTSTGINGNLAVATYERLGTPDWAVVVELPVVEAYQTLFLELGLSVGAILLIAGIAALGGRYLSRRLAAPLLALTEMAIHIAEGELDLEAPTAGAAEVGRLAGAFNSMTAQLRELIQSLEQRVAERTRDAENRSIQLEAAAQIARDAAAIRDVSQLLNETVQLISDRFGFYHAGIFLLDETGEYAMLRAASSEGGQRMLARGHRLRVGRIGIVGYAAGIGEPRIALHVGADAVYFDNPDLPLTLSEMALPLKVRGEVIGVLDVQSTKVEAFTEADLAVLQILADQVALAIENARLLEESRRTLQELEAFHGQRVREDWQEERARRLSAYRYTQAGVVPVSSSSTPETEPLPFHGRPLFQQDGDNRRLIAPIRLRKEAFGSIVLNQDPEQEPWSPEELAIVEEVSNQVALALENARLLETTQRRATQERLIGEITANIRESLDLDVVLQTAVREMGEALDIAEVQVRMWTSEASDETGE